MASRVKADEVEAESAAGNAADAKIAAAEAGQCGVAKAKAAEGKVDEAGIDWAKAAGLKPGLSKVLGQPEGQKRWE